jgi:dolichol-phosphate mannosyltransferase
MIYIILPIYNESKNIAQVIKTIRASLKHVEIKIVAVNDGSSDNSLRILTGFKGNDLAIESSVINMNVGAVFSSGISRVLEEASADDVMIIMESDGTSSPDLLNTLVTNIKNGADIVIASRYQPAGAYRNFPLLRTIFSWTANMLLYRYFPIAGVRDYTIFYRAYRIGIIQKAVIYFGLFGLIQSQGFTANAELLVKLSFLTKKISEIPFVYDYGRKKGKSKIGVFRTMVEYISTITYLKQIENKILSLKS